MKIDINKKYRTREGMEVRFLHRVPEGWPTDYPWRGIVGNSQRTWTDHGVQDIDDSPNDEDLVEVREPREWWLNIYPNLGYAAHLTPEAAEAGRAGVDSVEVIRVREIID